MRLSLAFFLATLVPDAVRPLHLRRSGDGTGGGRDGGENDSKPEAEADSLFYNDSAVSSAYAGHFRSISDLSASNFATSGYTAQRKWSWKTFKLSTVMRRSRKRSAISLRFMN